MKPVTTPTVTPVNMKRRQLSAMLLSVGLTTPSISICAGAEAAPPKFSVIDFNWIDEARSRSVPVRLYWPTHSLLVGKSRPLIVFSHGIGGSRQGYSYLGKEWSSRGVASLHVQHTGSDSAVWRGNPFGLVERLQAAAQENEAIARTADVRFALDQLLSADNGYFGAAIDPNRIIAAGHSYGANTTLLLAGAQVIRNGLAINCADPRFSAAVVISAPPFYGESDLPAILGKVQVPTMHITSTDDVIEIPGYRSAATDRVAIYDALANPHKLLAVFRGGSHSMFTDRSLTGGPLLNPKVKVATAELAMAFLKLVFEQNGTALAQWGADWQHILERMPANAFESVAPQAELVSPLAA